MQRFNFTPSLITPNPPGMRLAQGWPPADGFARMQVVSQGSTEALHGLRLAWHFDQACLCLLENAAALCRRDASQQATGLEQNDAILTEHHETSSFHWHEVDVSLAHVRKARWGTAWLRCHVAHESASWHVFLGGTEAARVSVKECSYLSKHLSPQLILQLILPSGHEGTCEVHKSTLTIKSGSKGDSVPASVCTFI